MKLSKLVSGIQLSVTLALDARAKALAAEGRDVINMSVGQSDLVAPELARAAAIARIESGDVRYTPAAGAPWAREAVAEHLAETRGVGFEPADVMLCHSAKHALSGTLLAVADPGDEVVVPQPSWVSYIDLIGVAGARPVPVPPRAEDGVGPDLDALEAAITPRTRAILINSPCNPSGYVWTRAETERVGRIACEHDLVLISDEIYRRLVFEGEPACSPASVSDAVRSRTVVIDGASKAFAMTGYRIGFLAGPRPIVDAVTRLHSQTTGAPNTVSQAAYAAALRSEPPEVAGMVATYRERRDLLLDGLRGIGIDPPTPRGAFYVFPDVSEFTDERGTAGLCEDLLEQHGLAVVPGTAFGREGHIRLGYTLPRTRIAEAVDRLGAFVAERRG